MKPPNPDPHGIPGDPGYVTYHPYEDSNRLAEILGKPVGDDLLLPAPSAPEDFDFLSGIGDIHEAELAAVVGSEEAGSGERASESPR